MTTRNEEPEAPPPPTVEPTETAHLIATIPDDAACDLCTMPLRHGQSVMVTSTGRHVHAYCWENK